jgi:hypothetical protein
MQFSHSASKAQYFGPPRGICTAGAPNTTSSLEEWRFKLIANVAITAIIIVNFVFIGVIFIIV